MLTDILARHRGPYRLQVKRPHPTKDGFTTTTLRGTTLPEDVGSEALALLTDPRDHIVTVFVWSDGEGQCVTTIRGEQDL